MSKEPQDRIKELEQRIVDIEQHYQLLLIKFINYIQAIESSTTLVKDTLRHLNHQ
jgi:hypothetical protein